MEEIGGAISQLTWSTLPSALVTMEIMQSVRKNQPVTTAQRYAAPNKFFDAIACGTPPICAPHPQCVEVIRKWRCGLLVDDWSSEATNLRAQPQA